MSFLLRLVRSGYFPLKTCFAPLQSCKVCSPSLLKLFVNSTMTTFGGLQNDGRLLLLTGKEKEEVVNFLATDFICREPLSRSMGAKAEDSKLFLREIVEICTPDALSCFVRDKQGAIVSAVLNKKCTIEADGKCEQLDSAKYGETMSRISDMLNYMVEHLTKNRQLYQLPTSEPYLEIEILSVKEEAAGQGLAKRMLHWAMEKAANEFGCSFAITIATNVASQKLFGKLGFKALYTLRHEDYLASDGKQIFTLQNDPTDSIMLMMKHLRAT